MWGALKSAYNAMGRLAGGALWLYQQWKGVKIFFKIQFKRERETDQKSETDWKDGERSGGKEIRKERKIIFVPYPSKNHHQYPTYLTCHVENKLFEQLEQVAVRSMGIGSVLHVEMKGKIWPMMSKCLEMWSIYSQPVGAVMVCFSTVLIWMV